MSTPATPLIPNLTPSSLPRLPDPSTLDILPPLHTILSRLLLPTAASPEDGGKPPTSTSANASFSSTSHLDPLNPQNLSPLEIQHLSTAAAALKVRLAKARQALLGLPDMDRDIIEQEEEIMDLEERVRAMIGILHSMQSETGLSKSNADT